MEKRMKVKMWKSQKQRNEIQDPRPDSNWRSFACHYFVSGVVKYIFCHWLSCQSCVILHLNLNFQVQLGKFKPACDATNMTLHQVSGQGPGSKLHFSQVNKLTSLAGFKFQNFKLKYEVCLTLPRYHLVLWGFIILKLSSTLWLQVGSWPGLSEAWASESLYWPCASLTATAAQPATLPPALMAAVRRSTANSKGPWYASRVPTGWPLAGPDSWPDSTSKFWTTQLCPVKYL